MHRVTELALRIALPLALVCGCEPAAKPEPAPKAEPAAKPEPATSTSGEAPPIDADALLGVGPSGAEGRADRRQAAIDLLTDGRSAESLPTAATADGVDFDPRLAEKLAPKVWVSDGPSSDKEPSPHGTPQVKHGSPTVQGPLDMDIIRRIVRAHINEVRFCYDAGLDRDPKLAGNVTVDFRILATGKVGSSTVGKTTLSDAKVETCIAKAVARWNFPKPRGGDVVDVSYPFDLSASD